MADIITIYGVGVGMGTVLIVLCLAIVLGLAIALAVFIDIWHRQQLNILDKQLTALNALDRTPKWLPRAEEQAKERASKGTKS